MPSSKPTTTMIFDPEVLEHIDEFRYNNRFPTRSAAINVILRAGMDALKDQYPELDLSVKLETKKSSSPLIDRKQANG